MAAPQAKLPRTTFRRRLECLAAAIWFGTLALAISMVSKHIMLADLRRIEIVAVFLSTAYDGTPLKFKDPSKKCSRLLNAKTQSVNKVLQAEFEVCIVAQKVKPQD